MDIIKSKTTPTKTTLFLVPVLGFSLKELRSAGFINGYCFMEGKPHKDCIYMLFLATNQVKLGELIERYKDSIIDEIDFEKDYTVLVCPFPVKFIRDKEKFWQGSFSKFSQGVKELYKGPEYKLQVAVINKNNDMREAIEERLGTRLPPDSEVSSIPDTKLETLDIQLFINEEL